MSKKETTGEQLAVLSTEMSHIKKDISDIKNNHLHAIQEKFDDIWKKFSSFESKILNRLPTWATILISLLSSLVTGLIIYGVVKK